MKNPLYLTDQELEAWHVRNFGITPYADGSDCVDLFDASNDGALREHCIEMYRVATMPVTFNSQFTFLSGIRKDGKYKVSLRFPAAPNLFGGYEHGTDFTKLYSTEECREALTKNHYDFHNTPAEFASE